MYIKCIKYFKSHRPAGMQMYSTCNRPYRMVGRLIYYFIENSAIPTEKASNADIAKDTSFFFVLTLAC